ncbi:MAG TPA: glycerol kinase GlpK [Anaerolineae bacterium]|nr:glycerol kinase GlpK [Anaerolineae bacterium]
MRADYVLALDQGTTSSRAAIIDREGGMVALAQREYPQGYPSPGHVTHDAEDIWESQLGVAREVLQAIPGGAAGIAAVGIANQRETTIVWDRASGRPVAPAIVWQSRVTADRCAALRDAGHASRVRALTGLPLDAYFSGPKIAHILDSEPGLRARAEAGELCFGTVDSFLTWRLTGGRSHITDVSNASRTLLFDIHERRWDAWLCEVVGVPMAMLPQVRPSSALLAETDPGVLGVSLPIAGIGGDQMAATFGQACLSPGMAKNTYGTGAFALLNTGTAATPSEHGLLSTVLWQLGESGEMVYALEGAVFIAGAAVQWLRDGLRAIERSADVARLAADGDRSSGVVVVPAFVGLGAPHWDPEARGAILGLTLGSSVADIALATVDAMAYQVADVLEAMALDAGGALGALRVDGGAAVNDALLQFQADILRVPVERPRVTETTALGAAFLAGLGIGLWSSTDEIAAVWQLDRRFEPQMEQSERDRLVERWQRAVERTRGWAAS